MTPGRAPGRDGSAVSAARIHVTGVVQGVGFRPFVYTLATGLGLTGWVNNASDGVHVVVEGEAETLATFARELRDRAPAQAVVQAVRVEPVAAEGFERFDIRESVAEEGAMTLVSPDIATCPACLEDMRRPGDRRHGYPFTNCTNCGPRFTIIDDVPYDRPLTTMRDFPMCEACGAEYRDPADRRFHAQPDACPVCGPRLYLNRLDVAFGDWEWTPDVESSPRPHRDAAAERERTDAIVERAAEMLLAGDILAIKGLGGFHLACDATSEQAVARLRERKRRWGKPFAVMFPALVDVAEYCELGPEEAALLEGSVRPIVLLKLREAKGCGAGSGSPADPPPSAEQGLAPSVAPGLAELGVMLPYTPLHHLLLGSTGRPLVMTSGNLSDEPIATGNAEALRRLAPIADAFLLHDRPIRSRYDDSVARIVAGRFESVRRSRGYAPFPLPLPSPLSGAGGRRLPKVLAAGPEQKNTFCLTSGEHAFVSQHIGDMENAETLESYEETLALYERLFRIEPELVAYDLHPEYLSTKYALALGLPTTGVQHHHAHIASVTGEHACADRVIGFAFDGTGYGDDRTIWGGEVLLADWTAHTRFAHLRQVPMPGGAAAIARPARMAFGLLHGLDRGLLNHPGARFLQRTLTTQELANLPAMADRGINSPLTSSMGRLFDAVAALTGVRTDAMYEGQAAIELEAIADPCEAGAYRFGVTEGEPIVIDPLPVVEAILDDLARGIAVPAISARFHRGIVDVSVEMARRALQATGVKTAAVAGGVFMNRIVFAGLVSGLGDAGFTVLTHQRLPANDGGISFGQAVVALARADAV